MTVMRSRYAIAILIDAETLCYRMCAVFVRDSALSSFC